jgi:STE24 endopeptidase
VSVPHFLPVAVPPQTPAAIAYAQAHELYWTLGQLALLAVCALLLFTGLGARLRSLSAAIARGNRYLTLTLFAALFLILAAASQLPTDWLRSDGAQPFAAWMPGEIVPLLARIVGAALFLWIPYWLMRRLPRAWWLVAALGLVPVAFLVLVALPVVVDPLTVHYEPLKDKALAAKIQMLAARCGVHDIPVFIGGDDDTVVGLGPTKRIFLEDGIQHVETPDQIVFTVSHELKHYVLGDNWTALAIIAALLLVGFLLVHVLGRAAIARWHRRFGFEELSDPASLPLAAMIVLLVWLCALPAYNWEARHIELEADRFGLELSHQNRAAAQLFAGWAKGFPVEYDGFALAFRATHPSLGDRIRFANGYKPWEHGGKLVYGDVCKPA